MPASDNVGLVSPSLKNHYPPFNALSRASDCGRYSCEIDSAREGSIFDAIGENVTTAGRPDTPPGNKHHQIEGAIGDSPSTD
jgi:hypothetical protein